MRLSLFAAATLCLYPLAAHADTITVYNASGLFQNGSTLSGTLTLDETTGVFTAANILVGNTFPYVQVTQDSNLFTPGVSDVELHPFGTGGTPVLSLYFDMISFINYQGGGLASKTMLVAGQPSGVTTIAGVNALQFGALTPAQTPEPSSIALLGTGLVGMFGVARRKYMSA